VSVPANDIAAHVSLFREILANRTCGSMALARRSLTAVRAACEEGEGQAALQFLAALRGVFPSMAVLLNLSQTLLSNLSITEIDKLTLLLDDRTWLERIVHIFPAEPARVVTLSNSAAVFDLLVAYAARLEQVACCRSLPGGEGAAMCAQLLTAGINALLMEDVEAETALRNAHFALVGADMVSDDTVVNKVGTRALAGACRRLGKPCYVATGTLKRLHGEAAAHFAVVPPFERVPRNMVEVLV